MKDENKVEDFFSPDGPTKIKEPRLSMRLDTQLDSLLTERETKDGLTRSEIVRDILLKELTGKNESSYLMNELNTIKAGLREMLGLSG